MENQEKIESDTMWSKDVEHLLPKMTSLIYEGLHIDKNDQDAEFKIFRNSNKSQTGRRIHKFRIPLVNSGNKEILIKKIPDAVYDGRPICVTSHHEQVTSVRSFIGGLSHCLSNLLMAIWGNVSLVAMVLEKDHPIQTCLVQIESLIQNGSNLIHLLLGYISERRSITKRLRLKQLIKEIETYNEISGNEIDLTLIKSSIVELSKIKNKIQLAECMARVMNQMLTLVQEKRSVIIEEHFGSLKVKVPLRKIDALLKRGFYMIQGLQYYAGILEPQKKRISLKTLVRQQTYKANAKHQRAIVSCEAANALPLVEADPEQMAYVLQQLIDNAVDAVDGAGKVHLKVNTLNAEAPQERCVVHRLNNYAVITITDNGIGIANPMQKRIFDPFFTGRKGQAKTGLGLAAASGIIKSHCGYIQLRSQQGKGTLFKIYLPIQEVA